MKALPGFELRPLGDGQRSQLIDPSGQPRAHIDGAVLEIITELDDGYLVVSSDGDAFENCMHVTRCDHAFELREVIHEQEVKDRPVFLAEDDFKARTPCHSSASRSYGGSQTVAGRRGLHLAHQP